MWDEADWADAGQFHDADWELNDGSFERVDEVFDDLNALLEEALA